MFSDAAVEAEVEGVGCAGGETCCWVWEVVVDVEAGRADGPLCSCCCCD